MKLAAVYFVDNVAVPNPGRTLDHTKEIHSKEGRTIETMVKDGIAVVAVSVAGQKMHYVPMTFVRTFSTDEVVPGKQPEKVDDRHNTSPGAPVKK